MRNGFLMLFYFCMCTPLFALQIKSVVDNETTIAKISSIDVTRIFVQSDRIKSVKGLKGAYTRENDEKNGEIYLQPTPLYQDRAFTILIHTEAGRHFTLLLNPTSSPSETLMLVPKGIGHERAARFEQASSYDLTISHLIRDMRDNVVPSGYVVHEVNAKKLYQLNHSVTIQLKTRYEGLNLQGEIIAIKNFGKYPMRLNERQFYKRGTRAISLEALQLAPQTRIYLYRVTSHDR